MTSSHRRRVRPRAAPEQKWRVRVEAVRHPDPSVPTGPAAFDEAVSVARALGIDLNVEVERFVARFLLTAESLDLAVKAALAEWNQAVEVGALPALTPVSIAVERRIPPSTPISRPTERPQGLGAVTDLRSRLPLSARRS